MMNHKKLPVLGFAAFSGSGKTTLLEKLIPLLRRRGLRLAVVKHAHHDFEIDQPGKDSHRLRLAGAKQVLLASRYRTFLVEEGDGEREPDLSALLAGLSNAHLDLVLVEGFRHEAVPKIEVHRPELERPLLCLTDPHVIALACDAEPSQQVPIPLLPLNDPERIAEFITDWLSSGSA